jgi:hypothetical protein
VRERVCVCVRVRGKPPSVPVMSPFLWTNDGPHPPRTTTNNNNDNTNDNNNTQAHAPEYLQWLGELTQTAAAAQGPVPFPRTNPFRQQQQGEKEGEGGEEEGAEEEGEEAGASAFVLAPDALVAARRAAGAVLHAVDQVVSGELLEVVVVDDFKARRSRKRQVYKHTKNARPSLPIPSHNTNRPLPPPPPPHTHTHTFLHIHTLTHPHTGRRRNAFCVLSPPGHHVGVKGLLHPHSPYLPGNLYLPHLPFCL